MFCEKNEALIICHPIFNKREQGSRVIYALVIVARVFNNPGLKMYSLWGSRVPLNIPFFTNFAATINFYTHPGIISCYVHISFATFWVKRTQKLAPF